MDIQYKTNNLQALLPSTDAGYTSGKGLSNCPVNSPLDVTALYRCMFKMLLLSLTLVSLQ